MAEKKVKKKIKRKSAKKITDSSIKRKAKKIKTIKKKAFDRNKPIKKKSVKKKKIRAKIKKLIKGKDKIYERKILIVINKKARRVNEQKVIPLIKNAFEKHPKIKIKIKKTSSEKKAIKLTKKAIKKGYDTVVAVGGDGTINSVLNGAVNKNIKLGIIPMGTGNALSFETGLLRNITDACETIAKGKVKRVDTGNINGRYFLLMAGIGVDAWVLEEAEKNKAAKQMLGRFPYIVSSVRASLFYKAHKVKILVDDKIKVEGYQTTVSNVKYYAYSFKMTPFANMEDGFLDICVFKSKNNINSALIYLFNLTRGTHPQRKDIFYHKAKKVVITSETPLPVQADGELLGNRKRIVIKVVPSSLNLIVP